MNARDTLISTEAAALPVQSAALPALDFLGVRLTALDRQAVAGIIAARDARAPFAYVVTPNAQHFVKLDKGDDKDFAAAYDHAWMRLCDSQVARRLARLLFGLQIPLVAGSDLTAWLFAHHIRPGDPVTVIGGSAELDRRLRERFHLEHLSMHVPPMGFIRDPAAVEACVDFVNTHPARYVFLAVGMPQSEILACRIAQAGRATGVGMCVGSSLLFVTDITRRAPPVWRDLGLEWLYRLLINPRGHAKRVFVDSLPLLGVVMRAFLRGRGASGLRDRERE